MFIKKNQKINIVFLILFFIFFIFNFLLISNVIAGEGVNKALSGLTAATDKGFGDGSANSHGLETDVPTAIGKIVGVGLAFIGTLFLILIIYGGFVWMFARGNEQEVEKAKNLITQAVIGLVIVLAAYAVTSYIGSSLTTSN